MRGIVLIALCLIATACTSAAPTSIAPAPTGILFEQPQADYIKVGICDYGSTQCASKGNYHTGIDSEGSSAILASGPGIIAEIVRNGPTGCKPNTGTCDDHGLGNTVILEHTLTDGSKIYSLYGHLDTISDGLVKNQCITQGFQIGTMGASGYGDPNYWGKKKHLHLEFKISPVLGDPKTNGKTYWGYINGKANNPQPDNWGFRNPEEYINKKSAIACEPSSALTATPSRTSPAPAPTVTPPSSPTGSATKKLIVSCDPSGGSGYLLFTDIYAVNVDGSGLTHLDNFASFYGRPVWSPDGKQFAVIGTSSDFTTSLFVVNADGSGLTNVANNVDMRTGVGGYSLTWSPDSARLAFASGLDGQIYVVNADGSGLTKVSNSASYDDSPAWSPDGARIAFASSVAGERQIFVMNADGSERIPLTEPPAFDTYPVWLPDSRQIVFYRFQRYTGEIMLVNIDHPELGTIKISEESNMYQPYVILSDGRMIYDTYTTWVYKDGSRQTLSINLPEAQYPSRAPLYRAWSADGTQIAYMALDDQVYIINVDGSGRTRLTNDLPPGCFFLAWQPFSNTQSIIESPAITTQTPSPSVGILLGEGPMVTSSTTVAECPQMEVGDVAWVTVTKDGVISKQVNTYPLGVSTITAAFGYNCIPSEMSLHVTFRYNDEVVYSGEGILPANSERGFYWWRLYSSDDSPLKSGTWMVEFFSNNKLLTSGVTLVEDR